MTKKLKTCALILSLLLVSAFLVSCAETAKAPTETTTVEETTTEAEETTAEETTTEAEETTAEETTTEAEDETADTDSEDADESEEDAVAPALDKKVLEEIKSKGKLVVGTEAQYPPYEFKDLDANFVGADIWLAEQIAAELDVELEIIDMSFAGIIPAIQSGQVDLGIAAFTRTDERAKEIDFSDLYETSKQYLIVATDDAEVYKDKESLEGKKIGAQKGTIQSALILSALPDSELFELEKYPALAMEVQNGNIAGLVVDAAVGDSLVETSKGTLSIADFEFTDEEASIGKAIAIAKGQQDLVDVVNKVVAEVTENGGFEKAFEEAVELQKELGLE